MDIRLLYLYEGQWTLDYIPDLYLYEGQWTLDYIPDLYLYEGQWTLDYCTCMRARGH